MNKIEQIMTKIMAWILTGCAVWLLIKFAIGARLGDICWGIGYPFIGCVLSAMFFFAIQDDE